MADDTTKISTLPLSENLDDDDLLLVVEDGVSKKAEVGYLKTKFTEDLATVASSGSYNDLSNRPTIPAEQIQSDWNQASSSAKDYIKNKPTIPSDADDIGYDNTESGLTATDVQAAIDELAQDSGGGTAASVTYNNATSGLVANNVQNAIDEVAAFNNEISTTSNGIIWLTKILTQDGAIYATGSEYSSTTYKRSDFIHVKKGETFSYALKCATGAPSISFYTSRTTTSIQQAYSVLGDYTLQTGEWIAPNDGYIRVVCNVNNINVDAYIFLKDGQSYKIYNLENSVAGKASATDVANLTRKVNTIAGVTDNMFEVGDVIIGTNSSGNTGFPKRAITKAYNGTTLGITVSVKKLPSNLKYEVDGYNDENFGGLANISGGWVTDTSTVTVCTTRQYVRILFGSVNNNNLTNADFEGLEMKIEVGQTKTSYMPKDTAVDYVARDMASAPVRLSVCSYNVGLYSYGISSDEPPADANDNLSDFLSQYPFDMMGVQENRATVNGKNINETVYNDYFFSQFNVGNGCGIKSQYQLTNTGSGNFTAGNRPYVYGTLNIGNKEVFVMSVHLGLYLADRTSNYTELLSMLAQHERFIVFGDFNAANEYPAEDKAEQSQDEYDTFIEAGYTVANGGRWGLISTVEQVTNYLDNVIVSPNIKMTSAKTLDVYNDMDSDHIPLVVDIVV